MPGFLLRSIKGGRIAMAFRLRRARYDRKTERAYVELWDGDDDGGEQIATAIFSYRNKEDLTKRQIEDEVVRKARHVLKRAALSTN
jgi:hypothetical protein